MRPGPLLIAASLAAWAAAPLRAVPPGAPLGVTADAAAASISPGADALYESPAVTVRARALPPQISERDLSGQEARQMPGTGGDVLRAVGSLPGAVTPNDYLANLLVRGAGLDDNLILLDGLPVAYPFHFGGLESVFHPGLIGDALFLPGGFDARFGDTLGGVLDLRTQRPDPGVHGELGASLIQAQVLASVAQGAFGWSAEGAWRQGTLQLLLGQDPAFAGLPAWSDWNARLRGPAFGGTLRLMGYGATDSLVAAGGPVSSSSRWDSGFESVGGTWIRSLGGWSAELRGWNSLSHQTIDLGPDFYLSSNPFVYGGRFEAGNRLGGQHGVDMGVQWEDTRTQLQGNFVRQPLDLVPDANFSTVSPTTVDDVGQKGVLGTWIQDRWRLLPGAAMTLGGRYDRVDLTGEFHFSPRWSLELKAWPGATLKGAFGDYFESPTPMQTVPGWSSEGLGSSLVRNYSAGVDQRWGAWRLELEAYHKDFQRDIPDQLVPVTPGTSVTLNAVDTGWSEGAEALLHLPALGPVTGWLSYAWSDVMRSQGLGGFYPGDFSQPQVGSLVLQAPLPWTLLLGARLRLASGIPYTPVASRTPNGGSWTPTFGPTNSARLDPYERLDLRLQKRWQPAAPAWWRSVTVSLDVINVTNAENVTSVTYNTDYSDIHRIPQFPRLAFLGADLAF